MANGKANTTARLALAVSILSAGFTGVSLYYTWLQGPHIEIGIGDNVLLNSKPRIGVLCTIANTGSDGIIIDSAELQWDAPAQTFNLTMTSPRLEEWVFDDNGKRQVQARTAYTLVSPIAIRGRDQASGILWFTSDTLPRDWSLPPAATPSSCS